MPSIVCSLEPNEIGTKQASEKVLSYRETAEDLAGGEGDVHEEADGGALWDVVGGTEEVGDEHEVVVVYPDNVPFLVAGYDGVGETLVDGNILGVGGRFVEEFGLGCVGDCIVEAWPEDLEGVSANENGHIYRVRTW